MANDVLARIDGKEGTFDTLKAAIGAARANDVVILEDDVTLDAKLTVSSKKITLDLNGHTLLIGVKEGLAFKDGSVVTIQKGNIQGMEDDSIFISGTNTTVVLGEGLFITTDSSAIHVQNKGKILVEGASIATQGEFASVRVEGTETSLEMSSGEIKSAHNSALTVMNGASAVLSGGELATYCTQDDVAQGHAFGTIHSIGKDSIVEIKGDVQIHSGYTNCIAVDGESKATVSEDALISCDATDYAAVIVQGKDSSLDINGGTIESKKSTAVLNFALTAPEINTTSMTSGTVIGNPNAFEDNGAIIQISGGMIKGHIEDRHLVEGMALSDVDELGYSAVVEASSIPDPEPEVPTPPSRVTITFKSEGNVDSIAEIPYGDTIGIEPDITGVEGKKFLGWFTEDGEMVDLDTLVVYQDTVLYAHWEDETPASDKPDDEISDDDDNKQDKPVDDDLDELNDVVSVTSILLTRLTKVYAQPARKKEITKLLGAAKVLSGNYTSPSGEEFVLVEFNTAVGHGKAQGFIAVADIK